MYHATDAERREIGCHSSCDDYMIFTVEKERKKEAEYKANLASGLATAYSRERITDYPVERIDMGRKYLQKCDKNGKTVLQCDK